MRAPMCTCDAGAIHVMHAGAVALHGCVPHQGRHVALAVVVTLTVGCQVHDVARLLLKAVLGVG